MKSAEVLMDLGQSFDKKQMALLVILFFFFPLSKWGQTFRKLSVNVSPCFTTASKTTVYIALITQASPAGHGLPFIGLMSVLGSPAPSLVFDAILPCQLFLK